MQQTERQQRQPTSRSVADISASLPGKAGMAAATILSAALCWFWLIPALQAMTAPPIGNESASELAAVADEDMDAALATMQGPSDYLAQFKPRASGCPTPLAWVSIGLAPGQAPAKFRVQAGPYVSPVFETAAVPRRIALPYPAPYEAGSGQISVSLFGGSAMLALLPPWQASMNPPGNLRHVVWKPVKRCVRPNG